MKNGTPILFESGVKDLKVELQLTEAIFKDNNANSARNSWAKLIDVNHINKRVKLGEYDLILRGNLPDWQPRAFDLNASTMYIQFVNANTGDKDIIPILLQDSSLTKLEMYIRYTAHIEFSDMDISGYFKINATNCGSMNAVMLYYRIAGFSGSHLLSPTIEEPEKANIVKNVWENCFEPAFVVYSGG